MDPQDLKRAIEDASKAKPKAVPAKAFGVEGTFIRIMDGAQRDAWETGEYDASGNYIKDNLVGRMLAHVLVNDADQRIYSDEEIPALGKLDGVELNRLWRLARKVNRVGKFFQEQDEKNS